jgi:hypothetical protein
MQGIDLSSSIDSLINKKSNQINIKNLVESLYLPPISYLRFLFHLQLIGKEVRTSLRDIHERASTLIELNLSVLVALRTGIELVVLRIS